VGSAGPTTTALVEVLDLKGVATVGPASPTTGPPSGGWPRHAVPKAVEGGISRDFGGS
jgi:hypothetical protein